MRHDSASCVGAGVPEKMSEVLNAQGKHKYADCGEGDPKKEAPLFEIPEVVKTPPRTALATAKRKEVCSIFDPREAMLIIQLAAAPVTHCARYHALALPSPSHPGGKV